MPASSLRFTGIGTTWQIDTDGDLPEAVAERVRGRVEEFDRAYSRFRSDSLVSSLAREPGSVEFPADSIDLFDLYDRLDEISGGAVTPLVGRSLEHLGYDSRYSLTAQAGRVVPTKWAEAVSRNGATVTTTEPTVIDVGAAGKGYLVDLVAEVLRESGITDFVIDASGDLVTRGEPLRVGLEHPFDPSKAIGVVTIENESLCASGSNRRVWGAGLHHILDGRTGSPTSDIIATWAIAPTGLLADGLATALFFVQPARLAEHFEFDWVRMHSSGIAERSRTLRGEVFS
ncbi:FAD:protein FMN transferase [Agreia pratensis]|uniref:FAD:protein FMN transferase n=1 Tax=Agreia pratensis TaxID=150121 RepID=A0A1X7HZ56_9MICO|nr:FAD:protein FMN transferase [Agreia pratensis]MBF4633658.1 FAD:protein FMN transferase [Agreia pratensis]SMG07181.1 thiamine biosynthesis lipoprotein [Agreia pratensis]